MASAPQKIGKTALTSRPAAPRVASISRLAAFSAKAHRLAVALEASFKKSQQVPNIEGAKYFLQRISSILAARGASVSKVVPHRRKAEM